MTHKALIRRLQISCLGLDAVDPLRLLVDDVIAALAQQEPVKYSDYESDGVHHNKPSQPEQEPVAWMQVTKYGNKLLAFTEPPLEPPCYTGEFIAAKNYPLFLKKENT
jgi:hypothetical protein